MSERKPPQIPDFDQIVKGNVNIKKLNKDKYKITFSKIGKFLMYQVWDKDSIQLNKKRIVQYVSAKEWIKTFKGYNKYLEKNGKPLFTPTTIMETENDDVYAFVIHKAYMNPHGKVVFTVSTEEISPQNNSSKKLTRLPEGKCNNMRFDIDDETIEHMCYRVWRPCMTECTGLDWGTPEDPKTPETETHDCDMVCCDKVEKIVGVASFCWLQS